MLKKETLLLAKFFIAIDRGANLAFEAGSFGWVIATDSIILVENGDQILCKDPDSFWAESYAILLVLIFCRLISQSLHILIIALLTLLSDSKSFLN